MDITVADEYQGVCDQKKFMFVFDFERLQSYNSVKLRVKDEDS
jgi:hypothetical protein